ncbi:GNAT family N-acetyltransferase [bacterium]|nr:MAG: GNAT family N-acetyltransferase [bacterium]
MKIRALIASDVTNFRDLRLRALKETPTAFSSNYEREAALPQAHFLSRIEPQDGPDNRLFGAFDTLDATNTKLVGMLSFTRENNYKRAHIGNLWSMYVAPEYRGQHISSALLDTAIIHAQNLSLHQVLLSVNAENTTARQLYTSRGFERYGLEPDALFVDGHYYAEEFMIKKLNRTNSP